VTWVESSHDGRKRWPHSPVTPLSSNEAAPPLLELEALTPSPRSRSVPPTTTLISVLASCGPSTPAHRCGTPIPPKVQSPRDLAIRRCCNPPANLDGRSAPAPRRGSEHGSADYLALSGPARNKSPQKPCARRVQPSRPRKRGEAGTSTTASVRVEQGPCQFDGHPFWAGSAAVFEPTMSGEEAPWRAPEISSATSSPARREELERPPGRTRRPSRFNLVVPVCGPAYLHIFFRVGYVPSLARSTCPLRGRMSRSPAHGGLPALARRIVGWGGGGAGTAATFPAPS